MRSNRQPPEIPETPEPTIGELFRSLLTDVGQLVRSEVKLVYAEVRRNVARATRPLAFIAIGAVFIFGAFLALLGAFVGWLAPVVGAGNAALIVAVVVGGTGTALLFAGQKRLEHISLVPTRTISPARPSAPAAAGAPAALSKGNER